MFKKLFGSSEPKEEKILPWIALNRIEELDTIAEQSETKTQLILSTLRVVGLAEW
ncbi:MAG: hypothetical protein Tsb0033_11300 [Winogradskyella sp.]